jgi:predicted DNA-binding transcriptional regulator AlpA
MEDTSAEDEAQLVGWEYLANLLGVSRSTIDRMAAAGKLPRAIMLSSTCRKWRLAEIRGWVAAGCPSLEAWERTRQNA